MKNKFICELFFEDIGGIWPFLIHTACQNLLGISPKLMSIYTDKEELQDIFFEENKLFNCLEDSPGTVLLKETDYDRSLDNFWFQIKKEDGKHLCVSWCNGNLNFLLDGGISQFLTYSSFTAGYCFCQSEVRVSLKKMQSFEDEPNFDWRTQLFVSGLAFMAAPIMWFGKSFFFNYK